MKKISFVILISTGLALSSCNSPSKTGNDQADSGSHGSSGASDTTKAIKSPSLGTSASGNASSGSDTTTTNH